MTLDEEISQFEGDEQSVFAEQLRQFDAKPLPIAYGLLAHIDVAEAKGWFWAGEALDGCLVSVKRIAQGPDLTLIESPSCKQWRISLLADVDAKVVIDHSHAQSGNYGLEEFESPLSPGLKRRLLTYSVEPGRQEYYLRKGSFHHVCEISLLPRSLERIASVLAIDCQELEWMISHTHTIDRELQLRNAVSSFSVSRMRLPGAKLYLRGYAYRVIAGLVDFLLRGKSAQANGGRLSDVEISEYVKASFSDDIANPLSLDELASALHISKTKLCESFARNEKMTVGSYLMHVRVAAAKELLMNSDASIGSIASELGFSYQGNFSAMFKRVTGKSPNEWRKFQLRSDSYSYDS